MDGTQDPGLWAVRWMEWGRLQQGQQLKLSGWVSLAEGGGIPVFRGGGRDKEAHPGIIRGDGAQKPGTGRGFQQSVICCIHSFIHLSKLGNKALGNERGWEASGKADGKLHVVRKGHMKQLLLRKCRHQVGVVGACRRARWCREAVREAIQHGQAGWQAPGS